ncbi:MAG: hypothetical protein ACRCUM_01305 [Mycoplasmoidaceae bacterium]
MRKNYNKKERQDNSMKENRCKIHEFVEKVNILIENHNKDILEIECNETKEFMEGLIQAEVMDLALDYRFSFNKALEYLNEFEGTFNNIDFSYIEDKSELKNVYDLIDYNRKKDNNQKRKTGQ